MAKRECGTCRFFEKSGIGETGHCGNERCREIVGIALMRKHELGCRVGWDEDYYEPLPALAASIPGQDRPPADITRPRGFQGTRPDDLVVAVEQTRPVTSETTTHTTPSRSRQSHVSEAHRRALERQQRARQSGTPLPPRRLEGVAPGPATPPGGPNTTREWEEKAVEGVSRPRRAIPPPPTMHEPPFVSGVPVDVQAETTAIPVVEPSPLPPLPGEREDRLAPPAARFSPPPQEERQERGEHTDRTAPMPPQTIPPGAPAGIAGGASAASLIPAPPAQRYPLPEGVEPGGLYAQWYLAERQHHRGKRCGNCRDFRPAEVGERGYCRNRFAFTAPQLVGPNDLACLNCLGTWWAANDQWWLHRADITRHEEFTPQADRPPDDLRGREERDPQ